MINFDDYANKNKTEHNRNWPYIPDHPYRILIIGGSGSGKTNLLLNLIENQPDIDKIYLYAKDPYESKYQYLINKRESVGINHFNDSKAFIDYSNNMHDVYRNIDDYNPVFTTSMDSPECLQILFNCLQNVKESVKEIHEMQEKTQS